MPAPRPFYNHNFNESSVAVCDTSFLNHILGLNNKKDIEQECDDAVFSLTSKGGIAVVPIVVATELYSSAARLEFSNVFRGNYTQSDVKDLKQTKPERYGQVVGSASNYAKVALDELLNKFGFLDELFPYEQKEIELAIELQKIHQFPTFTDAVILAIAIHNKATHILTTDRDFLSVVDSPVQVLVDKRTYEKRWNSNI